MSGGLGRSPARQSINTAIWAQSLGAPMASAMVNGGVLALFILALDGSKFAVGVAFTMNFFAQMVRPLVAPRVDVVDRRRMVIIWFGLTAILFAGMFLAYPISLAWGSQAAVWYVVFIFLVQRVSMNIGAAAWGPLLGDVIPDSLRGRFFGRMRRNFQIVSFVLIVLIGWYLGTAPPISRFYVIFMVLFVMCAARPLLLLRLPASPPVRVGPAEPLRRNLARPFHDREFRRLLVFWASVAVAINLARPFAVPFLKQDLGFPSSITSYASAGLLLGMVVVLLPWGKAADKFGNKFVFLLNILLMAASFNLLSWVPVYEQSPTAATVIAIAAFILAGSALGGLGIAHTVREMYLSPAAHRGAYMAVFATINGFAAGTVSTFSGAFLEWLPDRIRWFDREIDSMRLFFAAASLLVLATLPLLSRLKPVAEMPIRFTAMNFISLLPPSLTVPMRLIKMDPHQRGGEEADEPGAGQA